MRTFLNCDKGNFAVVFSLALLPVLGAAGMATDYSRAVNVRSFLQAQTDAMTLAAAQLGPEGDAGPYIDHLRGATEQRYGGGWAENLTISAEWLSPVDYRVSVEGLVPTTILGAVPGFPAAVPVGVSATARVAEPKYVQTPPVVSELDPDAHDYNRIYVYCFDYENRRDRETRGRTQMTAIADNIGTVYDYEMPSCGASETLSFRLVNIRNARINPSLLETGARYEYYTDTVIGRNGAEEYNISCSGNNECRNPPSGGWDILETVLCDTRQQCTPKSQGGIIPEGAHRTPQRATQRCSPGKYMYYGWEDRPGGDQDYDDIRIVIACPSLEKIEDRLVRLID